MTVAERREIARRLIAMRILLWRIAVFRAQGEEAATAAPFIAMDIHGKLLPLRLRRSIALARYIGDPATRRMERIGILALADELGMR